MVTKQYSNGEKRKGGWVGGWGGGIALISHIKCDNTQLLSNFQLLYLLILGSNWVKSYHITSTFHKFYYNHLLVPPNWCFLAPILCMPKLPQSQCSYLVSHRDHSYLVQNNFIPKFIIPNFIHLNIYIPTNFIFWTWHFLLSNILSYIIILTESLLYKNYL